VIKTVMIMIVMLSLMDVVINVDFDIVMNNMVATKANAPALGFERAPALPQVERAGPLPRPQRV
jgi:hypothetical protein